MDQALVSGAQHGDERAFEALARESHARLQAIAIGILRDPHVAEDAVQQALLGIWRDLPQLREPDRFEAWSYRILVRICYAEAKRQPRWAPESAMPELWAPAATQAFEQVAIRDQLERAFQRMPVEHRAVVVLHRLLGMPIDEVAQTLDVPVGTIKSRLSRAMTGLRAAIEAEARAPVGRQTQRQGLAR